MGSICSSFPTWKPEKMSSTLEGLQYSAKILEFLRASVLVAALLQQNVALPWVAGFVLIPTGSAGAKEPTRQEQIQKKCAIAKAKATAAYVKCLTRVGIKEIKQKVSHDLFQLVLECEAKHASKFTNAETRALRKGVDASQPEMLVP